MPAGFVENDKPRETVEFFVTNTKARPMDLEGEVLPGLIALCGDVKSGRVTQAGVEAFLDKNVLVFDRDTLKNMFVEADFRKEGSLDARALKAALIVRYPKRQLIREWRQLLALIFAIPELVLAEDLKHPRRYDGTFNKESVWDGPPPELPKPPPRRPHKPKALPVTGEWASTTAQLSSTAASGAIQGGASTSQPGPGSLKTSGGPRAASQSPVEASINASLQGTANGTGAARSTFASAQQFTQLTQSQLLASSMGMVAMGLASGAPGSAEKQFGSGKASTKAWSATLPPSAVSLPASALSTLRHSVQSTLVRKPDFASRTAPLGSCELDLKKTLGAPMDVTACMARVEPVRDTRVMPQAGYQEWSDLASRSCRTAPSRWFNEHPAAPAPQPEHPYPW